MPNDSSRAYRFALETWDNVYSCYWWSGTIYRVQLFSASGPIHWIEMYNGVPQIKDSNPLLAWNGEY